MKEAIIENVAEYSPAQLAGYIRQGIVTYEELAEEPEFSNVARREVMALLADNEDADWEHARVANTIEEYDAYLAKYPEGKHRSEAREAKRMLREGSEIKSEVVEEHPDYSRSRYTTSGINRLKQAIEGEPNPQIVIDTIKEYLSDGSVTKDQIYAEIRANHNLIDSYTIDQLDREKVLPFQELEYKAEVNPAYLTFITNNDVNSVVVDVEFTPINTITPKTTEIYFWGIPQSGKTCALGAILNEARHGGYIEFADPVTTSQGYHYMTVLSQIFEGNREVFKLPEGTQTDAIFEMGYVFKRDGMDYPVTFIDLSGETIESMYRVNARQQLNPKKQAGLDMACRLLTGNAKINRKIHFFVLEYDGHKKKYMGLTQDSLLTGAMGFIRGTGIFRTETDAVYLLVTKSDLTGAKSDNERNAKLADYIRTNYQQFYNGLKGLCKENEINEGNVDIIPFSLGDVCFQNLCMFDSRTADTVIKLIVNRAKGFKTGKLAKFWNKFKG